MLTVPAAMTSTGPGKFTFTPEALSIVVPLPNMPLSLLPKHHTSPDEFNVHVCASPIAIAVGVKLMADTEDGTHTFPEPVAVPSLSVLVMLLPTRVVSPQHCIP